ncbi:MAG: hypothetical protein JW993_02895 [Sedimentisphaerales bacterium]|nr:hypothetical protein [Sedimentisphaerales bacterium]
MNGKIIAITILGLVWALATSAAAALPQKVEDGVMLHCHGWPLSAIEANLDRIAAAGFNAIQVSPVQKIRAAKSGEVSAAQPTGPWWLFYQPVSFKSVGNHKLGTEADFKDLCDEAEQRGIKIIVDVVLNHVADTGQPVTQEVQLDPELRDASLYHQEGSIQSYQDRRQVTQRMLGSLPDLKTQDQRVQDMHVQFLNTCIDLGADGFRFDAAKHMETSGGEDAAAWAGDYWEDVLGRLHHGADLYLFGEVLQDQGDNLSRYLTYYDVTCHNYGGALRLAVQDRNLSGLQSHTTHLSGIERNRGLAYVENHDDYEHDKSKAMTYWERKVANAYLIARAGLVPRVLDRPEDDLWEDPDIVAVNHFRNAVVGTEEFLRVPSSHIATVERGDKAVVIINVGYAANVDVPTALVDGTYVNRASTPCTLQAASGRLKGQLPGGAVFVAYDDGTNPQTTIRATYDTGWGHRLCIRGNTPPLSWSKGIDMQWTAGNVWVWQTQSIAANTPIEFKVLIDDVTWEIVDGQATKNHTSTGGATVDIAPVFP